MRKLYPFMCVENVCEFVVSMQGLVNLFNMIHVSTKDMKLELAKKI